ncbi:MAG: tetratricopeptide repeat protein [Candidatus Manganitrophus sp.]|nr:tetratricopeptide repeat protein [Candidatus Manganitrophus sp.]WDT70380.1 MAG: tetratricopeptide repeat protein [Candidatus Manganitrophus sp.]WDT82391.1 MAG: tetratricopeptide repeat protein [Candidatus Manganitrophus sp.]
MMSDMNHSGIFLQGMIFLHRGQFESARRCFGQALEEARAGGKADQLRAVLLNLGNASAALGDREKARSCYLEILALDREQPDAKTVGQTLVNLGNLCREGGEFERARAYYLEAADLLQENSDDLSSGVLYSNRGLLEEATGHLEEAINLFRKAIDFHKKAGHEEGLAATWGQLGRVFLQRDQDRDAETCFNYATTHFNRLGDPSGESEALRGLAAVYERRGDRELALHCLERITEIEERYRLPPDARDHEQNNRLRRK